MQRNPAYKIPSEVNRTVRHEHTVPNTAKQDDHERPQHSTSTGQLQAIPKLSIIAFVLSAIALVAALVCFILIFTQAAEKSDYSGIVTDCLSEQFNSDSQCVQGKLLR